MLATNVAEPDANHAATLLACARDLLHVLAQARARRRTRGHGPAAGCWLGCSNCTAGRRQLALPSPAHLLTQHPCGRVPLLWVQVRLPGGQALDVGMALASCPANSGLLGSVSLTYQVGLGTQCFHSGARGRG